MDQNDNRPVFRQEAFSGRVLEGAVPGEAGGLRRAWGALSPSEGPGGLQQVFQWSFRASKNKQADSPGVGTLQSLPVSV